MSERTHPLVWAVAPHVIHETWNAEGLAAITKYGDLSVICYKEADRLRLPAMIANTLATSKERDSLLLSGDQYIDLLCVAIWFMYHKSLTVLLYEHSQYCAYVLEKKSLMSLVQRARDTKS